VRFYTTVADASPVPLLLYNFTPATGVNLLPPTVATLAAHPNIVGIKESGSDIAQAADHVALTPPGFNVLSGSGSTFHAALCVGVSGGILAVAGVVPDACVQMFEHARAKQYDAALAIQRRILPMARLVSTGYGVPGLKAVLKLMGCDMGYPRPPLAPVPDAAIAEFKTALAKLEEVPA
jgi:dihydrodipicolinate synthase/N-acetylneuraminate lyase